MSLDALIFLVMVGVLLTVSGLVAWRFYTRVIGPTRSKPLLVCWADDLLNIVREYAYPRMMLLASGAVDSVAEANRIEITQVDSTPRRVIYDYKFNSLLEAEEFDHRKISAYLNATNYRIVKTDDPRVSRVSWISLMGSFMTDLVPYPEELIGQSNSLIPMGIDEDGNQVSMGLDCHVLISGETGSGKASAIWNIIMSLATREDVAFYGVDMKMGMELGGAHVPQSMWDTPVIETPDRVIELLQVLYTEMVNRGNYMKSVGMTKWEPSADAPLRIVIVDEGMDLADMARSKEYKDDMVIFDEILRKSRATGIWFVVALQNANLGAFDYARHFPIVVGLRQGAAQQASLLGSESLAVLKLESMPSAAKGMALIRGEDGTLTPTKMYLADNSLKSKLGVI